MVYMKSLKEIKLELKQSSQNSPKKNPKIEQENESINYDYSLHFEGLKIIASEGFDSISKIQNSFEKIIQPNQDSKEWFFSFISKCLSDFAKDKNPENKHDFEELLVEIIKKPSSKEFFQHQSKNHDSLVHSFILYASVFDKKLLKSILTEFATPNLKTRFGDNLLEYLWLQNLSGDWSYAIELFKEKGVSPQIPISKEFINSLFEDRICNGTKGEEAIPLSILKNYPYCFSQILSHFDGKFDSIADFERRERFVVIGKCFIDYLLQEKLYLETLSCKGKTMLGLLIRGTLRGNIQHSSASNQLWSYLQAKYRIDQIPSDVFAEPHILPLFISLRNKAFLDYAMMRLENLSKEGLFDLLKKLDPLMLSCEMGWDYSVKKFLGEYNRLGIEIDKQEYLISAVKAGFMETCNILMSTGIFISSKAIEEAVSRNLETILEKLLSNAKQKALLFDSDFSSIIECAKRDFNPNILVLLVRYGVIAPENPNKIDFAQYVSSVDIEKLDDKLLSKSKEDFAAEMKRAWQNYLGDNLAEYLWKAKNEINKSDIEKCLSDTQFCRSNIEILKQKKSVESPSTTVRNPTKEDIAQEKECLIQ